MNWATLIAAFLAFLGSIFSIILSIKTTNKTNFINVITSERVKWMNELRSSVSDLCSLTYHWSITEVGDDENQQIIKEIDRLMALIKLLLNPKKDKHKEILGLVGSIRKNASKENVDKLLKITDNISDKTQELLSYEWKEVKKEAIEGYTEADKNKWKICRWISKFCK